MHRTRTTLTAAALTFIVSTSLGLGLTAAAWASWSTDTDCAVCHEVESARGETIHDALPCVTCHADERVLESIHKDADSKTEMPKKLKKTEVDEKVCLTCHGDAPAVADTAKDAPEKNAANTGEPANARTAKTGAPAKITTDDKAALETACATWEVLAELTADSEALTDSEGTVVNPHDLPVVEEHADITCASCHKLHEEDADAAKTALKLCRSCHHEDVFACYSCHA